MATTQETIVFKIDLKTGKLIAGTNEVKTSFRNLGNEADTASKKTRQFAGTLRSLIKSFLIYKTLNLFTEAIKGFLKIGADFGLVMSKIKAITGASEVEFKKLETAAKQLALGTKFTATEVGELQLAYSKLGFSTKEILDASEATLQLATITGDDLSAAADVAGAAVRGFGLDASETQRVVDVMATSFASSALNLEHFRQSMKTIAPIANAANIDLETSTALLAKLSDAGLRGTRAATGLKNIMSDLTDPTSDLAKELGFTINNSEGLKKAFKELSRRGIDLSKATGLVDERAKAAFITLVNGTDDVDKLTASFRKSRGKAKEMADIVGDSLSVKWDKFKSSVEGFSLREGAGLLSILGSALEAMTAFINELDRGHRVMQRFERRQKEIADELEISRTPTLELTEALKKQGAEFDRLQEKLKNEKLTLEAFALTEDAWLENKKTGIKTRSEEYKEMVRKVNILEEEKDASGLLTTAMREEAITRKTKLSTDIDERLEMETNISRMEELRRKKATISEEYKNLTDRIRVAKEALEKFNDEVDATTAVESKANIEGRKAEAKYHKVFIKNHNKMVKLQMKARNQEAELGKKSDLEVFEAKKKAIADNIIAIKGGNDTIKGLVRLTNEEEIVLLNEQKLALKKIEDKYQKDQEARIKASNKIIDATEDYAEERLKERIARDYEAVAISQDILASLGDVYQTHLNNEMNALTARHDAELESFNRMQDAKLSRFDIDQKHEKDTFVGTAEDKAAFERQKALERDSFIQKQQDKEDALKNKQIDKENEIAQKAFKAEKANQLAQIAINTAVAISKATAQFTVAAPVITPLLIASGLAQSAIVASQKFQPRTYQDGGFIEGASHSEGGVPFTVAGRGGFEAEGGEFIFSKKSVDRLGANFLSRLNEGATMFKNGGLVNEDFARISRNSRIAMAAPMMSGNLTASILKEFVAITDDRFAKLEQVVGNIKVTNVATDTSSVSNSVQNAEAMATI